MSTDAEVPGDEALPWRKPTRDGLRSRPGSRNVGNGPKAGKTAARIVRWGDTWVVTCRDTYPGTLLPSGRGRREGGCRPCAVALRSGEALQARGQIGKVMAGSQTHTRGAQGVPEFRALWVWKRQLLPKPKGSVEPSEEGGAPQRLAKTVLRGEEPDGGSGGHGAEGTDRAARGNSLSKGVTAPDPPAARSRSQRRVVRVALKPGVRRGS